MNDSDEVIGLTQAVHFAGILQEIRAALGESAETLTFDELPNFVAAEQRTNRQALHDLISLLRETNDGQHSCGWQAEECDHAPCPASAEDATEGEGCTCGADA